MLRIVFLAHAAPAVACLAIAVFMRGRTLGALHRRGQLAVGEPA